MYVWSVRSLKQRLHLQGLNRHRLHALRIRCISAKVNPRSSGTRFRRLQAVVCIVAVFIAGMARSTLRLTAIFAAIEKTAAAQDSATATNTSAVVGVVVAAGIDDAITATISCIADVIIATISCIDDVIVVTTSATVASVADIGTVAEATAAAVAAAFARNNAIAAAGTVACVRAAAVVTRASTTIIDVAPVLHVAWRWYAPCLPTLPAHAAICLSNLCARNYALVNPHIGF